MDWDLQPPALGISLGDIPRLLAFDDEDALVECAMKTVKSIPALPRKSFTYLARVADLTDLWGYSTVPNEQGGVQIVEGGKSLENLISGESK